MITASSLARLRNCPSSAVLPRAENFNQWAEAGHEAHEELAIFTEDHPFAHLIPDGARAEVKLAYDVSTRAGRVIGEGGGRDYGTPGPFEIVGSTDVLGIDGDRVVVIDWKTGFADVEPAASNSQLWFYALAACRALGKSEAIVHVVYTQSKRVDSYEIDSLELAEFAVQLERLHMRVAQLTAVKRDGSPLETREGAWCKHCASKHVCASKNALLVQFASGGLAIVGDATMTPERAASAYEQLAKVDQLVRDAKKRLETYVDEQGPIALGEGRMYGRYVKNGNKRLDGRIAAQAISDVVGESAKEFATVAIEFSTSQAAIERAAKQFSEKRGAAKLKKAIVDRIGELGGVTYGADSMPIGEYMADRNESAERPAIDIAAVNAALESA